jgi:hypothetical protein
MYHYIPKELIEIEGLEDSLHLFVDLMIRKLHLNRHKGFLEGKTIGGMLEGLHRELAEEEKALMNEAQFDIMLEAVDCANMHFLLAFMCLSMSKDTFNAQQGIITKALRTVREVK